MITHRDKNELLRLRELFPLTDKDKRQFQKEAWVNVEHLLYLAYEISPEASFDKRAESILNERGITICQLDEENQALLSKIGDTISHSVSDSRGQHVDIVNFSLFLLLKEKKNIPFPIDPSEDLKKTPLEILKKYCPLQEQEKDRLRSMACLKECEVFALHYDVSCKELSCIYEIVFFSGINVCNLSTGLPPEVRLYINARYPYNIKQWFQDADEKGVIERLKRASQCGQLINLEPKNKTPSYKVELLQQMGLYCLDKASDPPSENLRSKDVPVFFKKCNTIQLLSRANASALACAIWMQDPQISIKHMALILIGEKTNPILGEKCDYLRTYSKKKPSFNPEETVEKWITPLAPKNQEKG